SAARKRKVSPLRTASSSSLTKMVLSKGGKGFFRDRQIEGETGAALARGDQAQMPALRLDDRAADRETHAHPVGFGRHERLEYLAPDLVGDAGAAVRQCDLDGRVCDLSSYDDRPPAYAAR